MELDDLILVSVDDHVVEPPGMFDGHLPDEVQGPGAPGWSPRTTATTSGSYEGQELPNIGLNAVAGRPPAEYGIDPTSLRRDAGRLLRHPRAASTT